METQTAQVARAELTRVREQEQDQMVSVAQLAKREQAVARLHSNNEWAVEAVEIYVRCLSACLRSS